jgi:hypothetical protein
MDISITWNPRKWFKTLHTKGNKISKDVKSSWMSMLEPLEEDNGIILSFVCSDASLFKFNLGGKGET